MKIAFYILISVTLVSLLSLLGALFLVFGQQRLRSMLLDMVSFSAGALFGNALLHLLPEAYEDSSQIFVGSIACLGVLIFFLIEKAIHWHHHNCHGHYLEAEELQIKTLGITNLIGDLLHNMIDGMAIAASFYFSVPLGFTTTLAIIAHEIPKEVSNFGVLLHAGFSTRSALFYNFLSALGAVLGAFIVIVLQGTFAGLDNFLVPFTAGSFLYIAGSDLIPELHKSNTLKNTLKHCCWMAIGMAMMIALTYVGDFHHH